MRKIFNAMGALFRLCEFRLPNGANAFFARKAKIEFVRVCKALCTVGWKAEFQSIALAPFQRWFPARWLEGRHLVVQRHQENTAQMG